MCNFPRTNLSLQKEQKELVVSLGKLTLPKLGTAHDNDKEQNAVKQTTSNRLVKKQKGE